MNYQTIASLAYEDEYLEKYGVKSSANQFNAGLFNSEYIAIKNAFLIAIIYGLSQAAIAVSYSIGGMSTAERIDSGKSRTDQFVAFHSSVYGCFVLGNAIMNCPNFAKGKMVAAKILSKLNILIESNLERESRFWVTGIMISTMQCKIFMKFQLGIMK